MKALEHGTVDSYDAGCGCSRCVLAKAAEDNVVRVQRQSGLRPARRLPSPPSTFARCRRRCGRLVWHFDLGLCARCAGGMA